MQEKEAVLFVLGNPCKPWNSLLAFRIAGNQWQVAENNTSGAEHHLSCKDSFTTLGSPRDPSSVTLRHPWGLPVTPPIWPRNSPRVTPVGSWGDPRVLQGDAGGVSGVTWG